MAEESKRKYGGIKDQIVKKLEEYEMEYFRWDKPIPFCGLYIYPAKVSDYEIFFNCTTCLTLDRTQDPEGLAMSNLDYLITKIKSPNQEESRYWSLLFQRLCELIFHIDNGLKCKNCGRVIRYDSDEFKNFILKIQDSVKNGDSHEHIYLECPKCHAHDNDSFLEAIKIMVDEKTKKQYLLIDGHAITSKDFDLLRQVVLFQNFIDYSDDSLVDPEIKEDYEARMKLLREKNNVHATLEKKIVALSISTSYSIEYIYSMTIRKFSMALNTVEDLIDYKINKTAAMSGLIELPKGKTIEHWLYKEDKDMYGDAYKDIDSLKNDVNNL